MGVNAAFCFQEGKHPSLALLGRADIKVLHKAGGRCCFCFADGGEELQRLLRSPWESARLEGACGFASGHLVASFSVGQRQDWHKGYFCSPFSGLTTQQTVSKTPPAPCWSCYPQRRTWPRFAPKFPSLWLIKKQKKKKKYRKNPPNCGFSTVGASATEVAVLLREAAPALVPGRNGGARTLVWCL